MRRVTVAVDPPYDVTVGSGVLGGLEAMLASYRRVVVVSQAVIAQHYASSLGSDPWIVLMGDGEDAKSLATVETLSRAFAEGGLLRSDAVVALGGGVVGDTAGFAAAVYHRGIDVVQVPTSLLAQVDAAIGGKTAVNLPEGKNLVGAFHQPTAVTADTDTLVTLPEIEFRSGLGEVAKYAVMSQGNAVVDLLRLEADRVHGRDASVLAELVAACVEIKAQIVAGDPEERTGSRAMLNYGHTLAHAIETSGDYALAHGEAVAVGLVFAANLACALERVGTDVVDRVHDVVVGLGLPVAIGGGDRAELLTIMRRDKKAKGGLTFVLPGPEGLTVVEDPPERALDAAFASVGVE